MVKKIAFLLIGLLCAAQLFALSPIKVGLRGGVSFQDVDLGTARAGDYSLSADSETGFFLGMTARINLPRWYLQPEIDYSYNKYQLTATPSAGAASRSTVKLNAIQMPILAGTRFLKFFRLEAGPVFNLWDDSKVSASRSDAAGVTAPAHSVLYARNSIGYMVGLGLDLGPVSLSGRYNGEFGKPLQTITIGDQTSEVKATLRTWQLSVGFNF